MGLFFCWFVVRIFQHSSLIFTFLIFSTLFLFPFLLRSSSLFMGVAVLSLPSLIHIHIVPRSGCLCYDLTRCEGGGGVKEASPLQRLLQSIFPRLHFFLFKSILHRAQSLWFIFLIISCGCPLCVIPLHVIVTSHNCCCCCHQLRTLLSFNTLILDTHALETTFYSSLSRQVTALHTRGGGWMGFCRKNNNNSHNKHPIVRWLLRWGWWWCWLVAHSLIHLLRVVCLWLGAPAAWRK